MPTPRPFAVAALPSDPRLALVTLATVSVLLSGCVAAKYRMAQKDTPPPVPLHLAVTQPPVAAVVDTVIVYQGPGSWKREAFWDEYVVTLHNQGDQPLTITSATLADFAGVRRAPGDNPWTLESESKTLERKYREAGVAFVRYTAPGVILAGTGVGLAEASLMSAGAAGAATIFLVALPVYYTSVIMINHDRKAAIVAEFKRRRLALPLTLAPGETRTGSLFFPMVPNPRSLSLAWSGGAASGELSIGLESLHGLHMAPPARAAAPAPPGPPSSTPAPPSPEASPSR